MERKRIILWPVAMPISKHPNGRHSGDLSWRPSPKGLPVIVSEGCHLKDTIARNKLGLVISYKYKEAARSIIDYLANPEALLEVSKNNVIFARSEYEPSGIAKKNVEFFQRVMNSLKYQT